MARTKELKAHRIRRQIDELYDELSKHQEKCLHRKVKRVHKDNSYYADPLEVISYWTEFKCPTCFKNWREDGHL